MSTRYITAHDDVYQAFPCASTSSNKRCGEKSWVSGQGCGPLCTLSYVKMFRGYGCLEYSCTKHTNQNTCKVSKSHRVLLWWTLMKPPGYTIVILKSMATKSTIIITGNVQLCVRCFGRVNGYMRGKSWHWNCFRQHQYSDVVEPERGAEPFDWLCQSLTCPRVLYICQHCTLIAGLLYYCRQSICCVERSIPTRILLC